MLSINRWYDGYKHNVTEYFCDFRLTCENMDQENNNEKYAKALVSNWLSLIENGYSTVEQNDIQKTIQLPEGCVNISNVQTIPQYNGRNYWATNIHLSTEKKKALDRIVYEGKHPYSLLYFTLKDGIDLPMIAKQAEELANLSPSSSSYIRVGSDIEIMTHACYYISYEGKRLRILLESSQTNSLAKLGIAYEGERNEGFFQAHNVFSSHSILSILYGNIAGKELSKGPVQL
jgi:hypothetical protein